MRFCIGITGLKGSGKDTVANIIKELYPTYNWENIKFAKKLKEACSLASGLGQDYFEDAILKERKLDKPIDFDFEQCNIILQEFNVSNEPVRFYRQKFWTPRKMLQYVGTDLLRAISPLIHVKSTLYNLHSDGPFICTDIRFKNEYEGMLTEFDENFFPFYVYRKEVEESKDSHESELQVKKLAKRCKTINNNGTLEDLKNEVNRVILKEVFTNLGKNNE